MTTRAFGNTTGNTEPSATDPQRHSEDAMASDKLSEGIRKFNADTRKLEQFARAKVKTKLAA